MIKPLGIAALAALGLMLIAPEAAAQYATPPPPPPTPPVATTPAPTPAVRCGACTIRCPGAVRPRVVYRYRYRYRYRTRYKTRCPRCRCPRKPDRRYNQRYHRKGGPYYGFGLGYFGLLKAPGNYQHLKPEVMVTANLGWNFSPIFGLELGWQGGVFKTKENALGAVKHPILSAVTMDLKFRLVRPRRYSRVIPFLQTGLGVYFTRASTVPGSDCEKPKTEPLSYGGGVQVGGGVDFYATKYMVIGAKVFYRGLFMSPLKCGEGGQCALPTQDPFRKLHGLSAELTIGFTWPN